MLADDEAPVVAAVAGGAEFEWMCPKRSTAAPMATAKKRQANRTILRTSVPAGAVCPCPRPRRLAPMSEIASRSSVVDGFIRVGDEGLVELRQVGGNDDWFCIRRHPGQGRCSRGALL